VPNVHRATISGDVDKGSSVVFFISSMAKAELTSVSFTMPISFL
jgi:hypothetical protein